MPHAKTAAPRPDKFGVIVCTCALTIRLTGYERDRVYHVGAGGGGGPGATWVACRGKSSRREGSRSLCARSYRVVGFRGLPDIIRRRTRRRSTGAACSSCRRSTCLGRRRRGLPPPTVSRFAFVLFEKLEYLSLELPVSPIRIRINHKLGNGQARARVRALSMVPTRPDTSLHPLWCQNQVGNIHVLPVEDAAFEQSSSPFSLGSPGLKLE